MTDARRSWIEEQQGIRVKEAVETFPHPVMVDFYELNVSLISILLILK